MTTDEKSDANASATQSDKAKDADATNKESAVLQNTQISDGSAAIIEKESAQSDDNLVAKTECNEDDVEMKNSQSLENLANASTSESEELNFKVVYNKQTFDIKFDANKTIAQLKERIQTITSVPPSMQKLCFKGNLNDNKTLKEVGIKNNVKVMLIGSTINDVIAVNLANKEDVKEEKSASAQKELLCRQKQHKKIVEKGVPSDAMPAWKNGNVSLPAEPLHGMLNKYGNKVRLTFKLEQDQLWVGTKERTEKLSMVNVRSIVSEPIEGHEEYHIMGIQTGPTEASRIWLYWVPAQYIDAIKDTILGK